MVGAGLSFNTQPATRGELGFKQCGSSIANYSDNDMLPEHFQGYQGGPFLQENHLVHPPPAGSNNLCPGQVTFRSRDIRGVPAPVFIPQQRTHRVNGIFQDSSRAIGQQGFHPQPAGGQETRPTSGAFDSMRNAFRNNQCRRPPVSQFPAHRGQPNRFEFSRLGSDNGDSYELKPVSNDMLHRQRKSKYLYPLSLQRFLTETIDSYVPTPDHYRYSYKRSSPQEYSSSPPSSTAYAYRGNRQRGNTVESTQESDKSFHNHSFSFELIPLDQAQRRQAERRASGQDEPGHMLNIRDQVLAVARNVSFATAGSNAGSPLLTPSAIATPAKQSRVSRFVPRAFAQFSSPLAGRESNTNGKTFHRRVETQGEEVFPSSEREVPLICTTQ